MRKTEVTVRIEGGQHLPAVNVKSYRSLESVSLPLDLGSVSDDGGKTFIPVTTDADFTHEWIETNVSESDLNEWWSLAAQDGWEQAETLAKETFGNHVETYSAGRSGGWLVVDGLPEVESWDAIMVSKWSRFAKHVREIADDQMHRLVWLVWANVYEVEQERIAAEKAEAERVDSEIDKWASLA